MDLLLLPNPAGLARDAGLFVVRRRPAEEVVGILYLAAPLDCGRDGVEMVGGTTTQFFVISSSLFRPTCLRFVALGGVPSGVGRSI